MNHLASGSIDNLNPRTECGDGVPACRTFSRRSYIASTGRTRVSDNPLFIDCKLCKRIIAKRAKAA